MRLRSEKVVMRYDSDKEKERTMGDKKMKYKCPLALK
jgi:hypothetical protein